MISFQKTSTVALKPALSPKNWSVLKLSPFTKKSDKKDKSNYRPVSLLSNISKVYERYIQEQLNEYFSDILSKYQCGFRQGYGTQNCLLAMIERLRKIRDKKGFLLQS